MLALIGILALAVGAAMLLMMQSPQWKGTSAPAAKEHGLRLLPRPSTSGGMSFVEALAVRRSQRELAERPLTPEQVAQLCWAAQGITNEQEGLRTAPSAGALFPITVFVLDTDGVCEYLPRSHGLRTLLTGDFRKDLQAAALDQPCVGAAPLCMVITIDVARSASKYGNRARRYCLLEAGHVAQNVLLEATAMVLGGVPIGAFDDKKVASLLQLPQNLEPVYLLAVGYPRGK